MKVKNHTMLGCVTKWHMKDEELRIMNYELRIMITIVYSVYRIYRL